MIEAEEIPQRCAADEDPCPKHVGQEVFLGWYVRGGRPDRVRVTIGGRTVPLWDSGVGTWWHAGILPQNMLASPLFGFLVPETVSDRVHELPCGAESEDCPWVCGKDEDCVQKADNHESERTWFWADTGTFAVDIVAEREREDGSFEPLCDARRTFRVERTTDDPDRQAADLFTTPLRNHEYSAVGGIHAQWHAARDSLPKFPGEDWLVFHRVLVQSFDGWRAFFGYPPVTPWDGSAPVPTSDGGYTMADATRPETDGGTFRPDCYGNGNGCAPGPWFTPAGDGVSARGDDLGGRPCHSFYDRDDDGQPDVVPPGQMRLADFGDDRALGCVLDHSHHHRVHASVPGTFHLLSTTPHDPLFYAYHKWASGVAVPIPAVLPLAAADAEPYPGVWGEWQRLQAVGPPGVTAVVPVRDLELAALPGVAVIFWEPVEGLVAEDLTVNGSPATTLVGSGAGPWVFSGFAPPAIPPPGGTTPVAVTLRAGAIRDADGSPFAGLSWSYTVSADSDGDLFPDTRDNCPDLQNTDQINTDLTSNERFGYDHHHHGDGFGDALGDVCDPDDDDDLIPDDFELASGTDPLNWRDPDPCPLDPAKIAPGPCGCGSIEVAGSDGAVTCAFASSFCGPDRPCDDGEPCTEDACIPSSGCIHTPASGPSAATCACLRTANAACDGQAIPGRITKKRTRACAALERAVGATKAAKSRRLGKKAARLWKAAAKAAEGRAARRTLSEGCRSALRIELGDGSSRASAFVSAR
jgi:hypothetical protein